MKASVKTCQIDRARHARRELRGPPVRLSVHSLNGSKLDRVGAAQVEQNGTAKKITAMKSNISSFKAIVQGFLAVAFLAVGFNRASAEVDPVSNHVQSEKVDDISCLATPCQFCGGVEPR